VRHWCFQLFPFVLRDWGYPPPILPCGTSIIEIIASPIGFLPHVPPTFTSMPLSFTRCSFFWTYAQLVPKWWFVFSFFFPPFSRWSIFTPVFGRRPPDLCYSCRLFRRRGWLLHDLIAGLVLLLLYGKPPVPFPSGFFCFTFNGPPPPGRNHFVIYNPFAVFFFV